MTKATIDNRIVIDKIVNSKNTSGYLTIKSSETITLDRIRVVIFLETRGRMTSRKNEILSFEIQNYKKLTANEFYKIPFTFDSSKFEVNSYQGRNVSFAYNLEVQIDVNKNDIDKLERSLFSKVKSLVISDNTLKSSQYIDLENLDFKYQVVESRADFSMQPNLIVAIITFLILGSLYLFIIPEFNTFYIILGIASILLSIYLITQYIEYTLGTITMETLKDEDAFICKLIKSRNLKLMNPEIYYEIIEKVIDNRGTSSSTYTERLYLSGKQKIPHFNSSHSLKFLYPKVNGLQTLKLKDISIFWQMNLEGEYIGLTLKYKCIFRVVREKKIASE